jgi:hypothetical protein
MMNGLAGLNFVSIQSETIEVTFLASALKSGSLHKVYAGGAGALIYFIVNATKGSAGGVGGGT